MAQGKNRLFWLASLAIASIPLAVTFFGVYSDRRWLTILSFTLFVICLLLSTCTFVSWKTFKFSTPFILQFLHAVSVALTPLVHIIRGIPVLGKVTNGCIKLVFWTWFIILMLSDVFVRKLLKTFVGLHEPSTGQYSLVNACDTNFQPCGEFGKVLDKEKIKRIEEGGKDFARDHDYDERKVALKVRPNSAYKRSKERPKSMDFLKYKIPGKHGSDLSSMTSADWAKVLEMANIDKSRYDAHDFSNEEQELTTSENNKTKPAVDRPRYSQPIATTLAMVSKLVYEDVPIIRHELARSGYDLHSFRAVAYKGRNIVLVFRGTDPLNLQNAWTDIQSRLIPIATLQDPPVPLGKCHKGIYSALGNAGDFLLPSEELAQQQREESQRRHRRYSDVDLGEEEEKNSSSRPLDRSSRARKSTVLSPASSFRSEASKANTLNLELSNHSVYHTIASSLRAAYILVKFLIAGLFTHLADPVDYRFAGEIRDLSAFAQACRWVDGLRLEHAEKEFRKMHQLSQSSKPSQYRGPSADSRRASRRSSLTSLYSQDEMNPLDGYDVGRRRRSSLSSQGSLKSNTKRLSLTSIHQVGHGHHRRRLSGHTSDNKDSFQSVGSIENIENCILDIYNNQYKNEQEGRVKRKKLRFYICGHSLGGGLATIFLAKLVQCNSPLLDIFSGLYTYGSPKIGDKDFSHAFGAKLACKMFHHVHNNDIFARLPFWGTYETPPGTLVFMDSARTLTLYPPDPKTLMPVPVRGISFMHLSGMLNVRVIMRMRKESWLRILERIVLPFFLNDHFPGDYVKGLAEGKIEIVVQDTARFGGVEESETGSPVQTGYFSFLTRTRTRSNSDGTLLAAPQRSSIEVDKASSKRSSYSGQAQGLNIVMNSPLADEDSGYGAENRSDDADMAKVRRRIVKYTHQDEDRERQDRRRSRGLGQYDEDYAEVDGEPRWRELSIESRGGRQKPTLRRSRSSSLSGSNRVWRMQRTRRGSIGHRQQQPKGELSTFEYRSY
ncbi:hypothetical protein BG011_008178 [Mortierella polycephala]|uniref:Fungal lipase-type domain-containing protein n=1 Tax=Mortierella polycephala TaxID=41804 RepID=A0A9P6QEF9_9FUNG|nr:hypothetical protein BG011_008178 [Mortierella polycephala]